MRHRILYLVLFVCLCGRVHAQAPHFTQAHRLPAWYNPAAIGVSAESMRIAALYRNQWTSVTSPFRTEAFFAEKRIEQHGLGFNLVNNHAGASGFRQLYVGGQWSLTKQVGKNLLSAGLHLGILQRSFDPTNMTFDEQYSADQGSAAAIPHTENFTATSRMMPDAGLGFLWRHAGEAAERFTPFAGAGVMHLNKPRETYILEEGAIDPRYTFQAGTGYRISETVSLSSSVQYSRQAVSSEFMTAVRGQMKLNETSDIEGLVLFRNADALALGVAYRWSQYSIGMSYDINIGGITGSPGAAEIMLVYTPEIKARAKKERRLVEVADSIPVNSIETARIGEKPVDAESVLVKSIPDDNPSIAEMAQVARESNSTVPDSTTATGFTPISEAIASILPYIGNGNDSNRISPPFNDGTVPDLASILDAFANGSTDALAGVSETSSMIRPDEEHIPSVVALPVTPLNHETPHLPELLQPAKSQGSVNGSYDLRASAVEDGVPFLRDEQPIRPMTPLPAAPFHIEPAHSCNLVQPIVRKSVTDLPLALEEPLMPYQSDSSMKTRSSDVPDANTPLISVTDQIEFDQWIGFLRGSRTVHGLYKLDVIEPALDLLLNDSTLSLELSMPLPEGHAIRKGIVKDVFVTKGLEPARIRILPESGTGVTTTSEHAGAVRVRILRVKQ